MSGPVHIREERVRRDLRGSWSEPYGQRSTDEPLQDWETFGGAPERQQRVVEYAPVERTEGSVSHAAAKIALLACQRTLWREFPNCLAVLEAYIAQQSGDGGLSLPYLPEPKEETK